MTVTATPVTIDAPMAVASARRRILSYFIFSICASMYLFPFMRLLLLGTDEGLLVSGAVRVTHGQVFSRDFFEIVGPGTFYWLAMFFKLFGVTFLTERICLFITSLGTGLLMYFLTRRVCGQYRLLPCVVLTGTYFGVVWPSVSHHVDSNFVALLSIACLVVWQDSHKGSLLFGAGVLAGATTCFLQPKGVLLLCAFVVWVSVQYRRRLEPLSSLGILVGGYTCAVGLVLLYFWGHHALMDLIYSNYLWPSTHYGPANVVPYAQGIFRDYWTGWTMDGAKWTDVLASVLILPFVLVAVLPALLPVLAVWDANNSTKPEVLLYWLCGSALWLAEIHRKDVCHLVFGSPLLIILCIYYLQQFRVKVASLTLQVISISAVSLACFNLFLVLAAHPMPTRVGTVAVFKSDPALAFLDEHVAPGQEIFVYPYAPLYYFLSATENPTRRSGLGYNYNSAADFHEAVGVLEQHQVKYVLWDTLLEGRALKLLFSITQVRPDERIIEPYFETHYKVVWEKDGVRIMERREDVHAN